MQNMIDECDNPGENLETNTHLPKEEEEEEEEEEKVQVLGRGEGCTAPC